MKGVDRERDVSEWIADGAFFVPRPNSVEPRLPNSVVAIAPFTAVVTTPFTVFELAPPNADKRPLLALLTRDVAFEGRPYRVHFEYVIIIIVIPYLFKFIRTHVPTGENLQQQLEGGMPFY